MTLAVQKPTSRKSPTGIRPISNDPLVGFEVQDREQVEKVLKQVPALVSLLGEIEAEVYRCFPESERLILAPVMNEPEAVIVRVVTGEADALAQLDRFDEAWTYPRWEQHNGRLMLTLATL